MRSRMHTVFVAAALAIPIIAIALTACTDPLPLTPVCSGSKCDGGTSNGQLTIESACADEAAAWCDEITRCFPDAPLNRSSCIDERKTRCVAQLNASGTSRTKERLAECTRDRATIDCAEVYAGGLPDTCRVLPGTLADGRVCSDDGQCQGRLCRFTGAGGCGVCTKLPGAGKDCSETYACDANLLCNNSVCVVPLDAGAACSSTDVCATNLRCIGRVCTPPIPLGATCTPEEGADPCGTGYCNDSTHVCTAYKTSTPGGACSNTGAERIQCPVGYGCAVHDGQTTGACEKTTAAPGESCAVGDTQLACTGGSKCIAGICTIQDTPTCP